VIEARKPEKLIFRHPAGGKPPRRLAKPLITGLSKAEAI